MLGQDYHSFSDFPLIAQQNESVSPLLRNIKASCLEAKAEKLESNLDAEIPAADRRRALKLQLLAYIMRRPDSYMEIK
ncbi:MAG: hypothetical protein U1B79_00855 [Candidatus Pacearchaeota archaeon]|nr:hypothetical protein [Nanoarchaeota archaeon]MDZ4226641.1 hypothetical protein [Candidatus Pacearchaeota archaeon]